MLGAWEVRGILHLQMCLFKGRTSSKGGNGKYSCHFLLRPFPPAPSPPNNVVVRVTYIHKYIILRT